MSSYMIAWLIFSAVMLAAEFVVPGAILGFLGIAGLMVAGLMYLGWIEGPVEIMMTFFVLSIVLILVVRTTFLRFLPGDSRVENTDEDKDAEGSLVLVLEDISPERFGRIGFRDSTWEARSDLAIKAGDQAIITGRDGNCWIVKPMHQENL